MILPCWRAWGFRRAAALAWPPCTASSKPWTWRPSGEWLAQTGVAPTDPLALDGKSLRGIPGDEVPGVHLVAAYAHDAQAVVAQLPTAGKGQELAAAKAVLGQVPLEGRLVRADAL